MDMVRYILFHLIILTGLIWLLNACVTSGKVDPTSEFHPHIEQFLDDLYKYRHLERHEVLYPVIKFGELPPNLEGLCNFVTGVITINRTYWNEKRPLAKKALVYHELGHCMLSRYGHNDGLFEDMCSITLMATSNKYYDKCLESKWGYYVEELFN